MPNVGDMKDRYRFQRRTADQIVGGVNQPGDWGTTAPDAYTCAAATLWLKGSDAVQAARLQGDQPAVITVHACAAARAIDTSWKATDTRIPGRVLEITSAMLTPDKAWVEILAVWRRGNADA